MKSVIKMGKTIEEAIEEAIKELNVNKSDVDIEILEEPSKGLLGLIGKKNAKVKVTVVNDPIEMSENLLKEILKNMDIENEFIINKKDNSINIEITEISSSDMGIIIGKRGNTLDAIQYILSLNANKDREDYIRILLDVKGYRAKREKTLRQLAQNMAKKAKRTKRPVKLEPMNPYERRIIHSALQNIEGIITFSEGEDPYRRVVIHEK